MNNKFQKIVGTSIVIVMVMVVLGYYFFIGFIIVTPEKRIIWNIYRENGELSYSTVVKHTEVILIKQEKNFSIYQSRIGKDKKFWVVSQLFDGEWYAIDYAQIQLSRQGMVEACIKQAGDKSSIELWKTYALYTDNEVKEQYEALCL